VEVYTYINGDKAIYTGRSEILYGDTCYEVKIIEGHRKGDIAHTYRAPGKVGAYTGKIGDGK
jgi:hypothetical protein